MVEKIKRVFCFKLFILSCIIAVKKRFEGFERTSYTTIKGMERDVLTLKLSLSCGEMGRRLMGGGNISTK